MTHFTTLVQRCRATNSLLADEIAAEFRRLEGERDSEREARHKMDAAMRGKEAMFDKVVQRAQAAGVDFSDLQS
jgi:hypothetical protein